MLGFPWDANPVLMHVTLRATPTLHPSCLLNIQYVALAALVIRYRHRRLSLLCYFACTAKIFHVCLHGFGPDKTITLSIILVDGCENWQHYIWHCRCNDSEIAAMLMSNTNAIVRIPGKPGLKSEIKQNK